MMGPEGGVTEVMEVTGWGPSDCSLLEHSNWMLREAGIGPGSTKGLVLSPWTTQAPSLWSALFHSQKLVTRFLVFTEKVRIWKCWLVASVLIAKERKQYKRSSPDEKINVVNTSYGILFSNKSSTYWYVLQNGLALKMSCLVKGASNNRPHILWVHWSEMSRIGKSIEIEHRLVPRDRAGSGKKWERLLGGFFLEW